MSPPQTPAAPVRAALDAASLLAVLDSLPHLVSLWDRDSRCVFSNTSAASAFGLTPTRMRGMTQVEVVGRHAVELVERNIHAALRGEATAMDRVLFDGEGGLRHYQVAYSPNRVGGEIVGYSTMWVDVTPQLSLLAEVSRDSARVARLIERQRLMALAGEEVLDQLDGMAATLAVPRQSRRGTGTDPDALAHELADAIAHLREGAEVVENLGVPRPRTGDAPLVVGVGPGLEHAKPLSGTAWSAPRLANRLDEEGVDAVAALLDELPVVITEWDAERVLRYTNRAATAFLRQWGAEDVVGRRLEEIADAGFVAAIESHAEAVLAGEAQSYYRRERTPDGEWLHFHVRYVPRLVGGEVVGVYAYATDITLRIEAAHALTAARTEHAALRERQAIQDELHAAVLQQLFGAKLAVGMAGSAPGDAGAHLAAAHAAVTEAADSLRSILETP